MARPWGRCDLSLKESETGDASVVWSRPHAWIVSAYAARDLQLAGDDEETRQALQKMGSLPVAEMQFAH